MQCLAKGNGSASNRHTYSAWPVNGRASGSAMFMIRILREFLTYLRCLIPPGPKATAKQIFAWRWGVASTAVAGLLGVFVIFGAAQRIGVSGFARADDIDYKIEQALEPVELRLLAIEENQELQGIGIKRLVKSDIAKDIHADKIAWCKAETSQEKQRLRENLDDLQIEYEATVGKDKRATEPDCA